MTTGEVQGRLYPEEGQVTSKFLPPRRLPRDDQEKRKILAQVIRVAILAILSHHTYQFGGQTRLQKDGSPIGLELAGALARIVMLWWDRCFLKLCARNFILLYLYFRYVDDTNPAGQPLPAGTRWEEGPWAESLGKMVTREERVEEDQNIEEDVRTMRELRRMANIIDPMIQMEDDCASNHLSKKLPILDIEVWVREMPRTETQPATKKLYYQYYSKPMASKLLIMEKSAMPARIKRTALTQYGLRILRNCKLELEWEEKAKFLSDFSEQLRKSGYNAKVHAEILQSILEG